MKKFIGIVFLYIGIHTYAQTFNYIQDSIVLNQFFKEEIEKGDAYDNLRILCKQHGKRLSGSLGADKSVQFSFQLMKKYNFDTVFLQKVMVPKWERGDKEYARIKINGKFINLNVCALGMSVGTPPSGLTGKLVEIQTWEDLKLKGERGELKNNIVFLNIKMPATFPNTFHAYGHSWNVRGMCAIESSKYGAVGVIIRSLSATINNFPHTGSMLYVDSIKKIPAMAMSTVDAEMLHNLLNGKSEKITMFQNCKQFEDVLSYNVIAEIKGTQLPNEYLVIGGHLDAWDLAEGAHDDGAGIMQSLDALVILKNAYKPKRSIRCVFFMNEENGVRGGKEYAKNAKEQNEKHYFALESDGGGHVPVGLGIEIGDNFNKEKFSYWESLFLPYNIFKIYNYGGGTDVNPLKKNDCIVGELYPDNQRYFDYHHAATDVFETVNERELKMGAFAMASLIYLVDQYEIK